MKSDNPFSLTFGMPPYTMIGRFEEKDRVISTFTADNAVSHVYLIEGIRGSGKTVLMTSISEELYQEYDSLLDDFAYRKIWSGLTRKEQQFILALRDTGSTRVAQISAATGASGSSVSQLKERLVNKGVLVNAGFGLVETALPRFSRICGYYHLISGSGESKVSGR